MLRTVIARQYNTTGKTHDTKKVSVNRVNDRVHITIESTKPGSPWALRLNVSVEDWQQLQEAANG
jgi:hypothetical protein